MGSLDAECAYQLFDYFLLPAPEMESPSSQEVDARTKSVRSSALRYREYIGRFNERLRPTERDSGALELCYRVLPNLYAAGLEKNPIQLPAPSVDTIRRIDAFIAGYRESMLPFSVIDWAVKFPEQPLFTSVPHETPSLELRRPGANRAEL